uniref:Protein CLP1 homolog n=1 Tax=Rhizophora mucronata TaxID=61149 RepID=A0A2P2KTR1_RHIMU
MVSYVNARAVLGERRNRAEASSSTGSDSSQINGAEWVYSVFVDVHCRP